MKEITAKARYATVLAALFMVLAPMTALASHNSVGANVVIAQPDEIDLESGETQPNVPLDHPFAQEFHGNLEQPRNQPADMAGSGYTDCQGPDEATNYDPTNPDHCYIGYMNAQWQYVFAGNFIALSTSGLCGPCPANPTPAGEMTDDPLYAVNPEPGSSECPGPAGSPQAYAENAVAGLQDQGQCTGESHPSYYPGFQSILSVDTQLVEAPFGGANVAPGVANQVGERGSGYLTFPVLTTYYLHLFGEPHPDNPSPSSFEAGAGLFGPDPLEGGSPVTDLTGACGDRTEQCKLLTPADIIAYDTRDDNDADDVARVCSFEPQFGTVNPSARAGGPCGVFGDRFDEFIDATAHGGFGAAAEETWQHTLPGWYNGVLFVNTGPATDQADMADEYTGDGEFSETYWTYVAVNPKVPDDAGPLWCVRPNILAEAGTSTINGESVTDPGFYASSENRAYVADAIDSDTYVTITHGPFRTLYDNTYDTVNPIYSLADDAADDAAGTVNDQVDETVPEELPGQDTIDQVTDQAEVLQDRATYNETRNEEPKSQPGPQNYKDWTKTFAKGVGCDGFGVPQVRTSSFDVPGGVRHDAQVSQQTVALKDPTILDEEGLPARESETVRGAWQIDMYSFSGVVEGVADTNENGQFDDCAIADGQPQPDADLCAWGGLWDAYNTQCTDSEGTACGEVLKQNGYDVSGDGVGMYFVLEVTGPVLLENANIGLQSTPGQYQVLGDGDATAQHCVIGVSTGFASKLAQRVGAADASLEVDDEGAALCSDVTNGETVFVTDAFSDQGGGDPGGFDSAINWAKLMPTPSAVEDNTGGLGDGDSLCVTSVYSVQDGVTVTGDTDGNVGITSDTEWTDCDPLDTTPEN